MTENFTIGERPWTKFFPPAAKALHAKGLPDLTNVAGFITDLSSRFGDRPVASTALPNGASATLTYAELDEQTRHFARYLREVAGLAQGDVVALQPLNCVGVLIAFFGALRAGLSVTNVNPLYTPHEVAYQLRDSDAKLLITMDIKEDTLPKIFELTDTIPVVTMSLTDFMHASPPTDTDTNVPLLQALAQGAKVDTISIDCTSVHSEEVSALFQYSGGTTGRSKGVELSFERVLGGTIVLESMTIDSFKSVTGTLLVLPTYHLFGMLCIFYTMHKGAHIVMIPSPQPIANLRAPLEKFEIDWLPGVNTIFAHLLEEDWFVQSPPKLTASIAGGTALIQDVADRWKALTGAELLQGYGLTEATGNLTFCIPGYCERDGSVGIPVPLTDLTILKDDNTFGEVGEVGEIVAKGPQVMSRYLGEPELTKNAFFEGWLRTGDMGYLDEDGFLFLVDRKKDMIIVSGFNVFPTEIEEVLAGHPKVIESCVVGIADDRSGQRVVAYVVTRDTDTDADALKAHCEERLTNYKRPREYVLVDSLPKSPVGKVLRKEVRDNHGKT